MNVNSQWCRRTGNIVGGVVMSMIEASPSSPGGWHDIDVIDWWSMRIQRSEVDEQVQRMRRIGVVSVSRGANQHIMVRISDPS